MKFLTSYLRIFVTITLPLFNAYLLLITFKDAPIDNFVVSNAVPLGFLCIALASISLLLLFLVPPQIFKDHASQKSHIFIYNDAHHVDYFQQRHEQYVL